MTSLFEKDILYLNCYKGQKGTNQMKCPYCNNPDTRVIDSRRRKTEAVSDAAVLVIYVGNVLLHMKK